MAAQPPHTADAGQQRVQSLNQAPVARSVVRRIGYLDAAVACQRDTVVGVGQILGERYQVERVWADRVARESSRDIFLRVERRMWLAQRLDVTEWKIPRIVTEVPV